MVKPCRGKWRTSYTGVITFLLLLFFALECGAVYPEPPEYAAIIVRGDIPVDWIVAQSYAWKRGIPVLALFNPSELDENTGELLRGLASSDVRSRILILGEEKAVPSQIAMQIEEMGFIVDRVWGTTRVETASEVVQRLWGGEAEKLVLVDGYNTSALLFALSISLHEDAPILYVRRNELPESTFRTITEYMPMLNEIYLIDTGIDPQISKILVNLDYSVKIIPLIGRRPVTSGEDGVKTLIAAFKAMLDIKVGLGALIGGVLVLLSLNFLQRRRSPMKNFINSFLTHEEKMVFQAVLKSGKLRQEELPAITGLTKPTVSRVVSELCTRNILKREKSGKTYILSIDRGVEEVLRWKG